ncbi:hypothetical protein [Fibrobacter sp. UWEL]|uniref:hypothetical protein n=1 Tax=Fibrobacter sp. UWEL TaxID=1896209 RepID=UPI0009337B68|nr:hypothetical protein [Fibrobacter sp. UWEL]
MRHPFYKKLVTLGAVAMAGAFVACGDDSGSGNPSQPASNICAGIVATEQVSVIDLGTAKLLVYPIGIEGYGKVTLADGTEYGRYDGSYIYDLNNTPVMEAGYADMVNKCAATATVDPGTGEVVPNSSASVPNTDPVAGSSATVPASSGSVIPGSSATVPASSGSVTPGSSATVPGGDPVPASSAAQDVPKDENGFPTLESYGAPPADYTKEIQSNGKTGWSSRYWDACKPHCSWLSSVDTTSEATYQAGMTVARNCNIHDVEVPAFTLGHAVQQYWMGYEGTPSACVNENAGGTYTCTDMAPIAVNENLSYGYVAGSGELYKYGCGKCYHLQFNGGNHANDVKATHKALQGKHMVVMVSNIGYDVEAGQFDMMVPGGGVGAFNALSTQIGVPPSGLGAGNGGFLTECQSKLGWDNTLEKYQQCVIEKCEEVFSQWPNLLRGCKWYAEWYMAADNPTFNWEEVECPQYLVDHYVTNINTTKENRYRWRDDWSDYKAGDELETQDCLTEEYPKGCAP